MADQAEFAELAMPYMSALYSAALRMTRNPSDAEEDFGVRVIPPSNPALLDWLASEFVRSGWDVQALQRRIVTSATYRQASKVTPALLDKDPENRLLARARARGCRPR